MPSDQAISDRGAGSSPGSLTRSLGAPAPVDGLFWLFSTLHIDELVWSASSGLRILMYHGICDDRLAAEPWLPPSFVTRSAFEAQLQYLAQNTCVLPLAEAVARLGARSLPRGSVVITFDDGYANNLHLAAPLLHRYGLPATVFVSTAHVESGQLFVSDLLRLIRLSGLMPANHSHHFSRAKKIPVDILLQHAAPYLVNLQITPEQHDGLRPLRIDELTKLNDGLIALGTHTHHHCILANENLQRRRWEITKSIRALSEWTGQRVFAFAYPNGDDGDYDERDKEILREHSVSVAVSAQPGTNHSGCDLLELRRYPVGLYHKRHTFAAEITGLRTVVRRLSGRL